jgi:hypothetical protein
VHTSFVKAVANVLINVLHHIEADGYLKLLQIHVQRIVQGSLTHINSCELTII